MGNLCGAEGDKTMIETLRHKEAFDYYYSLGDKRGLREVAQKFDISLTAIGKWSKNFNWQLRVQQRDIENSKNLEKKTNKGVINAKADFRRTIFALHQLLKRSLNEFIKSNNLIGIIDAKDLLRITTILDKLARLEMGFVGENMDGEKEIKVNGFADLFAKIAEYEKVFKDEK
jgi:hypothetical protein